MSDYVVVRFHDAAGAHDAPLDVVRLRDGWTDRPGGRNFHDFPAEPLAPRSIDRFHNPSGALRALRAHRSRRHAAA